MPDFTKGGDSQMSSENYRLFSTPIYWKMKDLFSKNVFYFVAKYRTLNLNIASLAENKDDNSCYHYIGQCIGDGCF